MQYMGDYPFTPYGQAHAQSYTEIRPNPDTDFIHFWGSLSEETGWTSFRHFPKTQEIQAEKDLHLQIQAPYCLFDLWQGQGPQKQQYQQFFTLFLQKYPAQIPTTQPPLLAGWTSWYLHYTNIDQNLILNIARDYAQYRQEAGQNFPNNLHWVIQIDDGWQAKTGDWLEIKTQKFPLGMKALADSIKAQGMMPGLWLAPFICSKASRIAKNHPDWLLKNSQGKPLKVGVNPLWDGAYYALDIYHPAVQAHLQKVFQTLTQDWGYELLKIDFLYAVAAQGRPDKSRAQVMHEAMRLLRSWVGPDVKLLGCGLPLAAGWGQVDYARIGADIYEKWDHGALRWARHRERLSTKLSLTNTLARHPLDGQIWGNDPDVVILRHKKHRLNTDQKTKLLYLNALSGSVFFNSDALNPLKPKWKNEYQKALQWFSEKQATQWRIDRHLQFQGKTYLPSQGHWLELKGGLKK
jgi:alpha-galactosidase